jgi:2-oxoglutarate ferredoxin oxidoreductase subunit alpha
VLAPSTLPELYKLTMNAFDYADYYRNPVLILSDGILGQMVEPIEIRPYEPILDLPEKNYILDGCKGRKPRVIKTLFLHPADMLMQHNIHLAEKYNKICNELQLTEEYETSDAQIVITAYGITARIAKGAVIKARKKGIKVGLIRPITLWPFPQRDFKGIAERVEKFLVVEMSNGQFIEDVKLAIECQRPVEFLGWGGGWYPSAENILEKIEEIQSD